MWEKIRRQFDRTNRSGELYYATHHHLVPLYVLLGAVIVALIFMGSYVSILWKNVDRDALLTSARYVIDANEGLYLPTVINPLEKKQYVHSANIRFPLADPYNSVRYSFDPGAAGTTTSSQVVITTDQTLREYASPLLANPEKSPEHTQSLQQCTKLYAVRFEPGLVSFGGFTPLKEVKLKDGRTAYIHKNASCVPASTAAMNQLDKIEQTILGIESF